MGKMLIIVGAILVIFLAFYLTIWKKFFDKKPQK